MLAAYTYSRIPCFLLVSRVWDISSGIGPCFPLAGGLCKFYAPTLKENDQYSANHSQCDTSSKPIHFYQCTIIIHLRLAAMTKNKQITLKGLSHEIDFDNFDKNWRMLSLISTAASFWIFWRRLWFLVEIKHPLPVNAKITPIAAVVRLILYLNSRQAFQTNADPFYE